MAPSVYGEWAKNRLTHAADWRDRYLTRRELLALEEENTGAGLQRRVAIFGRYLEAKLARGYVPGIRKHRDTTRPPGRP